MRTCPLDTRRLTRSTAWRPLRSVLLDSRLASWVGEKGSLTRRLRRVCGRFELVLLRQRFARPLPGESTLLGIRQGEHVWVREVLLLADGQPVLYAHSVAQRKSLRTAWRPLSRLGTRSMGDAVFELHSIRRSPIRVRRLKIGDHLHRAAQRALAAPPTAQRPAPGGLWTRRSSFTHAGHALWITEVFLPAIGDLGAPCSSAIIASA